MPSRAVSIADLKTNLSAHLARVRSGEELLIRDRHTTIAKICRASLFSAAACRAAARPRS